MVVGCRSVHAALWNPAHLLLMHIVSSDAEMHSLVGSALVAQRETSNNTPMIPATTATAATVAPAMIGALRFINVL